MLNIDAVEHGSHESRSCQFELLERASRRLAVRHFRADDKQDAVRQMGHHTRIGHRHNRRRVDDDPVEPLLERGEKVLEPGGPQELGRIGRNQTRRQKPESRNS